MSKRKEYPEKFDREIFYKFEKDTYELMTALKRNRISVRLLLIAGIIIYLAASFYPWTDVFFELMGNFVDVKDEAVEAFLPLVSVLLSPFIVFISWFVVTVILNIILKLTIKTEAVPADIKGDDVKRVRAVMTFLGACEDDNPGYGLSDKMLIKKENFGFGLSFATTIPLIAAVLYFLIIVVRSVIQLGAYYESVIGSVVSAAVFVVINFIPNLITVRILSSINKRLYGIKKFKKNTNDLFEHIRQYWWREIDEERARKCERDKDSVQRANDKFISTMAAVQMREQQELEEKRKMYERWMRGE